jgi:putative membrane protein
VDGIGEAARAHREYSTEPPEWQRESLAIVSYGSQEHVGTLSRSRSSARSHHTGLHEEIPMKMKTALLSAVLTLGLAGCMTPMASAPPPPPAVTTAQFVPTAASSNAFEIQSSRLALQRSRDPGVRRYAQEMIRDHNLAGRRMVSAVRASGMSPPPPGLSAKHEAMLADVRAAADFDAAYVSAQLSAHQEAVALFTNYASNGDDVQVVAFAKETLPTLQMHLDHVQALNGGTARAM